MLYQYNNDETDLMLEDNEPEVMFAIPEKYIYSRLETSKKQKCTW